VTILNRIKTAASKAGVIGVSLEWLQEHVWLLLHSACRRSSSTNALACCKCRMRADTIVFLLQQNVVCTAVSDVVVCTDEYVDRRVVASSQIESV
jgi:hypothetical protein